MPSMFEIKLRFFPHYLLKLTKVNFILQANKMGLSPFFCHNGDPLSTPPPAHCGIPPYQLDPKTMGKLTRRYVHFQLFLFVNFFDR